VVPGSEVRIEETFGVLKLTLHADSYDWQFIPEAGKTATDAGTGVCHGPPLTGPVLVEPTDDRRSRRSSSERGTDRRHQVGGEEGLRDH
jgi:hypothetical protein